jgi:hypothetical protein
MAVEKREASDLIVGIVVNILREVFVQHFKGSSVSWIPSFPWDFVILDSPEFVVLYPKIGFEDVDCCRQPEQRGVSLSQPPALFFWSPDIAAKSAEPHPQATRRQALPIRLSYPSSETNAYFQPP